MVMSQEIIELLSCTQSGCVFAYVYVCVHLGVGGGRAGGIALVGGGEAHVQIPRRTAFPHCKDTAPLLHKYR